MYGRALDLRTLVEHRSVFLVGPRQTGKSTLVRHTFPDAAVYDLLEADTSPPAPENPHVVGDKEGRDVTELLEAAGRHCGVKVTSALVK